MWTGACLQTEQSSATGGWTDEPLHLPVLPPRCHGNETLILTLTLTYVCIHHMHAGPKCPGLYKVGDQVLDKLTSAGDMAKMEHIIVVVRRWEPIRHCAVLWHC